LDEICRKNNWKKHTKSPIIWRELVDRGGKGMLVGDANDFQEYARSYYGKVSELMSEDLRRISKENEKTYEIMDEERRRIVTNIKPLIVTITNPQSRLVYHIVNEILSGDVFGEKNEIALRLYSKNEASHQDLNGLKMEIEDLASQKLCNISVVSSGERAFGNCDFAILLDELVQIETSDNEDLTEFHNPYITLAQEIDQFAKATCKVLITPLASRSEIYALVNLFSRYLNNIDRKKNLMGNSMCDEVVAKGVLANRLKVSPGYISNVIVVGQSLNDAFYVDLSYSKVTDYDGAVWAKTNSHWLNLVSMVADKDWIKKEFLNTMNERGLLGVCCMELFLFVFFSRI
jgi:malate/lactate dehydrogenase